MRYADLATITDDQNLLILAPGPLDESVACGGLIALSCRRGRPPFVMVLGDGAAAKPNDPAAADMLARLHDRETRAAVACLGLDNDRLLMAGLYSGQIPHEGPVFDTIVRAVTLVMWKEDCNTVCAPSPGGAADEEATYRIASAVSAASGVGLLTWVSEGPDAADGLQLDIVSAQPAKRRAILSHGALLDHHHPSDWEVFIPRARARSHVTSS